MTLEWWNSNVENIENLKKIAQNSWISTEKINKINNFENSDEKKKYLEALIFVNWRLFYNKNLGVKNSEKWKNEWAEFLKILKISKKEEDKARNMDPISAQKYLISIDNRDQDLVLMLDRWLITTEQADRIKSLDPEIAEIEIYETKAREQLLFDLKKEGIISEKQSEKYHKMSPKDAFDELLPIIDKRNFEYTIKKDDTLWKIVKDKLWNNPTNRDIFLELKYIADLNPGLNIDIIKYKRDILERWKDGIPWNILKEWQVIKIKENKNWLRKLTKKNIVSLQDSLKIA